MFNSRHTKPEDARWLREQTRTPLNPDGHQPPFWSESHAIEEFSTAANEGIFTQPLPPTIAMRLDDAPEHHPQHPPLSRSMLAGTTVPGDFTSIFNISNLIKQQALASLPFSLFSFPNEGVELLLLRTKRVASEAEFDRTINATIPRVPLDVPTSEKLATYAAANGFAVYAYSPGNKPNYCIYTRKHSQRHP